MTRKKLTYIYFQYFPEIGYFHNGRYITSAIEMTELVLIVKTTVQLIFGLGNLKTLKIF